MSQPAATGVLWTFFVLTCFSIAVSEVQKLDVILDKGTSLTFGSSLSSGAGCQVCTGSGRSRQCAASGLFKDTSPISVELECPKIQGPFNVEINRTIECNAKSCNGDIGASSNYDSLLTLNRKFIWNLKANSLSAARVDFSSTGLKQVKPSDGCPDKHIYTFEVLQNSGEVTVGRYCKNGPITNVQALGSSRFILELPAGQRLQHIPFNVSIGEEIKSLAKISLTLPQGMSSLELSSPNYPDSFPDNSLMEWHFTVPAKHKASIELFNVTQPQCLTKKPAVVEYSGLGRTLQEVRLTEEQPVQSQGSFTMALRNCEMDRRRAGSTRLSLNFKVSASKTTSPVLCTVDLQKMPGFSLYIEKLRPSSECVMKLGNSEPKDLIKLRLFSFSQLSFESCLPEEIQVTATKQYECEQLGACPKFLLSVPSLPSCFPAPLRNVTWTIRLPPHGTVELLSPSGPLRQELPGQPCNDNITIKMAEDDGLNIGNFCRNGTINKIQIHTNISISVHERAGNALVTTSMPPLMACVKGEISERYIFNVSPNKNTPLLLGTPGWPKGMKAFSTVAWIVTVPAKMEAHLMFENLRQPKCNEGHTNIRVKRIGRIEEEYSRQEDEEADKELTVSESFYLNMSNCDPDSGDFRVLTKITLQKSQMLIIIVSVVAALLVILIVVLVVVCVIIRKKTKKLNHQISIYNPNGTSFLPGQNNFPRSRADNESHVYEYIDDTLVYSHLLRKGNQAPDNDKNQLKDSQKPLVAEEGDADGMEVGIYQEFSALSQNPPLPKRPASHMQQMVDNDIYESEGQRVEEEEEEEEEQSPKLGPRLDPEGEEPISAPVLDNE